MVKIAFATYHASLKRVEWSFHYIYIYKSKMDNEQRQTICFLYIIKGKGDIVNNCFQTKSGQWVSHKLVIFQEWWATGPRKQAFGGKCILFSILQYILLSFSLYLSWSANVCMVVDAVFSSHVFVTNCFIIDGVTFWLYMVARDRDFFFLKIKNKKICSCSRDTSN